MIGRRWIMSCLLLLIAFGGAIAFMSTRVSNCGGNSAALGSVQAITSIALVEMMRGEGQAVHFATIDSDNRFLLEMRARNQWIEPARFLVSTEPITGSQQRLIVVCDTPFRNVRERWIGSAPPTHAAGFSDGTCRLISTAEFAALDSRQFVPLDQLFLKR